MSFMSSMQRIYQIDQILGARHSVTRAELQERLGVSWATLKRDIACMRDRLNAPLIVDQNDSTHVSNAGDLSKRDLQPPPHPRPAAAALTVGAGCGRRESWDGFRPVGRYGFRRRGGDGAGS